MSEKENFELMKRRSLTVWVYSLKNLKNLKRLGSLHYVSRKMKYVVIYVDEQDVLEIEQKIRKLHFVRKVERSYRPDLDIDFTDRSEKSSLGEDKRELFEQNEQKIEIQLLEED